MLKIRIHRTSDRQRLDYVCDDEGDDRVYLSREEAQTVCNRLNQHDPSRRFCTVVDVPGNPFYYADYVRRYQMAIMFVASKSRPNDVPSLKVMTDITVLSYLRTGFAKRSYLF